MGDRAGTGCPDDPNQPCDVAWAITSFVPDAQCEDDYGDPIGPNEQLLRFDIEIWSAPQFTYSDSNSVLFLKNWGVGDAQGVDTNLRDHTAVRCNGKLTGDQISQFIVPGTHMTKSIFITAPRDATVLRLYDGPRGDGWTWSIPAAG